VQLARSLWPGGVGRLGAAQQEFGLHSKHGYRESGRLKVKILSRFARLAAGGFPKKWPKASRRVWRHREAARRESRRRELSSSSGRPHWSSLTPCRASHGGRLEANPYASVQSPFGALGPSGKFSLVPRFWLMHNPSLKRTHSGVPRKPPVLQLHHSRTPGLRVTPPRSAQLER
jgi:hypothetical protein